MKGRYIKRTKGWKEKKTENLRKITTEREGKRERRGKERKMREREKVLHQNNSSFRRKGLNLLNFELVKTRNKKDR